jgi:hypothetical protein
VLIAYRDVTSTWRNSRSVKAALLFPSPATHKLPILAVPREHALRAVAFLNSTTFDLLARSHVPGASLAAWVLSQCAAPTPDEIPARCAEIAEVLSITSVKLADAFGWSLHTWDAEKRPWLEAECDALVARAYGVTRDEYEKLFEHFEVMERVEQANYGEYRTRRLCLEAWDLLDEEGV